MWRGGSRKWNEWKAVRERRRQEGKGERLRGEGECIGGRERERECKEKEGMVSKRERVCKEIDGRLTAKKEEVVE